MQPSIQEYGKLRKEIFDFPQCSVRFVKSPEPVTQCEAIQMPHYLLYHIIEGEKWFFSGNSTWQLKAGDSILIKKEAALSCEARMPQEVIFKALSIHLSQGLIQNFIQAHRLKEMNITQNINACHIPFEPSLSGCLHSLQNLFEPGAVVFEALIHHKITELLMHLFLAELPLTSAVCAEAYSNRRQDYLTLVASAIENPISTEMMAERMHMSLSAFKREFKQLFEQTPARYIMHRRLEKAQQLLLTTNESVQKIAFDTGFENPSHFVQAFKREYGNTPGGYRDNWPLLHRA